MADLGDHRGMSDDHRPAWAPDLLVEVDRAFAVTGAATPGWPDPWPERDAPEAAYSRVTDPERYRIVDARLAAWEQVLVARGLARVERADGAAWRRQHGRPDRLGGSVTVLVPRAAGALRLLALGGLVEESALPLLELCAAGSDQDPVPLDLLPDCGCDACDSGSADLLAVLDSWVLTVLRGGVVHVRAGRDDATRTWDGWAASNRGEPTWLDDPGAAPAGARVLRGEPWL